MSFITRRAVLGALATSPFWLPQPAWAQSTSLKISHQFPRGNVAEGDFRDRLCRRFAADVERRTRGSLRFSIYPGAELAKAPAQFGALRRGALDMALVPLSYGGPELPEVNIGLMPGLVTSYEHGYGWKNADVGKELTRILLENGIVVVSWIWQAGGMASRTRPVSDPDDVKGMRIRGGSHEMDLMLQAAGATVVDLPSNDIHSAMRSGALDAALTSSTSLISFRLQDVSRALTTARGGAYWFMFEPLLMAKTVFDKLTPEQKAAVMTVGAEVEAFARRAAQEDDAAVAAVYQSANAKIVDLNPASLKKWQAIARETAWVDYAGKNANCARLMALAEKTL
jgi:TRAP-type C4-dicarboxylate transport system substrate-binding protein